MDGLRNDFLLGIDWEMPSLRFLGSYGARAQALLPVYPSVTYPNHTTLVTGVRTARHGILSNRQFNWEKGSLKSWYSHASQIRVRTLWDASRDAGLTSAAVGWPVSDGAPVTWNLPEVLPENDFKPENLWDAVRRHTDEALWKETLAITPHHGFLDPEQHDLWTLDVSLHLLKTRRPDILYVHLVGMDLIQHFEGKNSGEAQRVARGTDQLIQRLLDAIDLRRTYFVVLGDHGFRDVLELIHINTLFTEKGWIRLDSSGKIADWQVTAHLSGGQAAVYVKDPRLAPEVIALLKQNSGGRYLILERSELDALGALPGALCAIEPAPGFGVGERLTGAFLQKLKHPHGEHGFHPHSSDLEAGLVIAGPEIPFGKDLGIMDMTDVAPTLARLLGLSLPDSEGKALKLK